MTRTTARKEEHHMNWQHLVYFRKIVEKKNFSKAADSLYIAPSTLSKAIRSLEEEIGFPLFEKQGRNSILTRYGEQFYPCVCNALSCLDEGLQHIQTELGILKGHVKISGIYTQCAEYLPVKLKQFRALYPDISFEISYHVSGLILDFLQAGKIDLGFCGDYDMDSPDFQNIDHLTLKTEELIFIAPKGHPLSRERYIDFERMKDESYIAYRNNSAGLNHLLMNICRENGFSPKIAYEVFDDYAVVQMVAEGLGIGLIPDNGHLLNSNVSVLRFRENAPVRTLYMVWKKNEHYLSPVANVFKKFIEENPCL